MKTRPAKTHAQAKAAGAPVVQAKRAAANPGWSSFALNAGDAAEHEADRTADAITQGKTNIAAPSAAPPATAQRKAKSGGDAQAAGHAPQSGGQSLPAATAQQYGAALGTDLSGVRVHTGSEAAGLAEGMQARAFTTGNDVVFNRGEYAPGTAGGDHLLAHELTHVAQQQRHGTAVQREPKEATKQAAPQDPDFLGPDFIKQRADVEKLGLTQQVVKPKIKGIPYLLWSPHDEGGKIPLAGLVEGVEAYVIKKGTYYSQVWTRQQGKGTDTFYWGWANNQLLGAPAPAKTTTPTPPTSTPLPEPKYYVEMEFSDDADLPLKTPDYDKQPPQPMSMLEIWLIQDQPARELAKWLLENYPGVNEYVALWAARQVVQWKEAIIREAGATGDHGIPAELLGAIMAIEMMNRGDTMKPEFLLADLTGWDFSLGVTQLKMSAAAMTEGEMGWTEAADGSSEARDKAKSDVKTGYGKLSSDTKDKLRAKLDNPDTALGVTARYLAKLKNRPNRYPGKLASEMLEMNGGCEILATEYNQGPTGSPAQGAAPSEYGSTVRWLALHPVIKKALGL